MSRGDLEEALAVAVLHHRDDEARRRRRGDSDVVVLAGRRASRWSTLSSAELRMGRFFSPATHAFTMKGRNDSFTPSASAAGFIRARSALMAVTSHSSTNVKCAAVCVDCCILTAIFRRIPAKGTRSSSAPHHHLPRRRRVDLHRVARGLRGRRSRRRDAAQKALERLRRRCAAGRASTKSSTSALRGPPPAVPSEGRA